MFPAGRHPEDTLTATIAPMSPGSSGELSPFDVLGDIGDVGPGSPTDDGLDGSLQDSGSGQKWDGQTEIAEQAKHEAEIENRIAELRKEGFWTPRRLSKFPEPARPKVQWDYLCEEMQWLSADFAQERRWKRGVARKVVRMVVRHHEEQKQKEERARREEQAKLRRIAMSIAKEVRQFWSNVEKVVQFKQQSRLEAKRKKALDLQLDFIVGQTEKYSDLLSQSLNEATPTPLSKASSSCIGSSHGGSLRTSPTPSICQKDGEFLPHQDEEDDDEETIEMEESQEGNDAESHRQELELLKRESELPLDELLQSLPPEILQEETDPEGVESERDDSSSEEEDDDEEEEVVVEEDDEFTANEEEAEDEEDTIAAEEALEGQQDHAEELSQLAREGEMSIEELLKKYLLRPTDDEETVDQSESSLVSEHETFEYSECDSSDCESEGVEFLVKQEDEDGGTEHSRLEPPEPKKEITDIAATAESLQPKGYTLATTQVKTPVPFLLRGDLREYQHIGLEWLVTMYEKKLNGILADEMGLGKTIQTISLLAHLACDRGNWGPHLIIVPTSVILNWEMELKRWCPSFKILTYYGSQKERKLKRQGWTKANAFHVCITSYKLVLQDHQAFRRKNWRYLILDEAQNIKNFKSQRWQSLLNFNSQRRLLLTGTPLQNSLMELWSLMHFLMPHVFQSHREFKEWFSNPLTGMIEGSQEYNEGLVRRLHKVLRPFLLRRIKLDVEKQMPKKYEHVIYCRLSKRQRFLYDDFMSQAATRESLASGHFMSVINILMQLRKVCNHPNLFDPRPIHSPFITSAICYSVPSLVLHALQRHPLEYVDTALFDLINMEGRVSRYESDVFLSRHKPSRQLIQEIADSPDPPPRPRPLKMKVNRMLQPVVKPESRSVVVVNSSRPVPKLQDSPRVSPPPAPPPAPPPPQPPPPPPTTTPLPFTPSNPPQPSTGASGPVQPVQVPPSVPPAPPVVNAAPVTSELGKSAPLQNSQPVFSGPQRFILTPDMQARLPSGEVISLSQLASLSGRPLPAPSASKPLTLQLQGAKLTLSGAQVRPVGQPRPVQGNVLHLVSSGGQHHLLSQPAQLALIQALAQQAASSTPAAATTAQLVQNSASGQIGVQTLSVQGLQHPLMNSTNIPPPSGPTVATPGQVVSTPGVVKIVVRQAPRELPTSQQRPPLAPQVRPVLRVLPSPHPEQSNARDGSLDRTAPVVATSTITLASSPLLMVSSPAVTPRLPSPSPEDCGAPSLSGVALRLVAAGTSPTVQLANHHPCPVSHTTSPAQANCSPSLNSSNCTTTQAIVSSEAQNPDSVGSHPVENGNGLQLADSLVSAVPMSSVPTTVNSPSPPATNLPKVSPPTYNLSLVPALIANSGSSNAARFLTSPLSLLALSPLASTNSGPTPVIYTPPNATAFPSPLPAATVAASLPLLATPVSGPLASFAAPLPISAANQNTLSASLSVPHPSMETTVPAPLATPTPGPLPMLSTPATLLAATASVMEASSSQPLLLSSDSSSMPLLDTSSVDSLPPLVLNTSLKLPPMASAPVPILPAPVSSTVPLVASGKVPVPLLSVTSASTNVPLLPASTASRTATACIPNQPPSGRATSAVASVMFTTSVTSVTPSSSPLLPKLTVQVKAPTPLDASAPPEGPCALSTEVSAPLLPSSALEPAMVSTLVASVPPVGSAQPLIPTLQIKAPLPSLRASTMTASMPASAPAPLPSLPASTPIPLPLLTASTPTPVSSLPASSPDPSSLLLVSAPAQAPDLSSPLLAPSVDPAPVSLLPSSAPNPLLISVAAPSPSLVLSTPSHIPLLPTQPLAPPCAVDVQASKIPKPSHPNLSASPVTSSADIAGNHQESKPESSLSLSIAGPPSLGVPFSAESEIPLEGDECRVPPSLVRPRRLLPPPPRSPFYLEPLEERRKKQKLERLERIFQLNERRCGRSPVYGSEILRVCTLQPGYGGGNLRDLRLSPEQRLDQLRPIIERFIIAMPPVEAPQITLHTSHPPPSMLLQESLFRETLSQKLTPRTRCLHRIVSNMRTQFPDLRLIQYDCGKLQTLDRLLRELKSGGHRVLLFTQMTRMLDVLEQFLNYHGHIYLRLDGSTRVEQRQVLMERFNMDKRIFCFILSTRSGGVGVNLTGADTVIFYDSDWNPTMDAQAQDRCHRIGQTRDVHIYRLVSERTVEENILKKAQQKRMLGDMAIEGGNFTTAYFKQQTIRELFEMEETPRKESEVRVASPAHSMDDGGSLKQSHILEQALGRAEDEEDTLAASLVRAEQVADLAEFNENVPLEPEEEEQSRVEQEISALVEQLTPIERYAMYFLEASLEEVSREELKQAEEQVEAARKDLILAKDESGQNIEEKWEEESRRSRKARSATPARPSGERVRMSERLRGNKATEPTDTAESLINVLDAPIAAPEVHCDASSPPQEETSVTHVDEGGHEDQTPCIAAAVTPEPTEAHLEPPNPQPEESPIESIKQEDTEEASAPTEGQNVPEVTPATPEPCEPTPGSPVTPPQEEPTPPRTPRRKVTADCEILLAGASDTSPAAKVLRRLPGRLVTVVQERVPAARRHARAKGPQGTSDNGALSPRDPLSEDNSEAGSPPPKRKRGRPPKTSTEQSPVAPMSPPPPSSVAPTSPPPPSSVAPTSPPPPSSVAPTSPPPPTSPVALTPPSVAPILPPPPPSSVAPTPPTPGTSTKMNSESESSSAEKRKRGRPPKRREASPATSPTPPTSPTSPITFTLTASHSSVVVSPVGALPPSPILTSPAPPTSVLGDTTDAVTEDKSPSAPASKSIIPIVSSNIPVSREATSSSDEPITPSKRKRGRPPRSQIVPKTNSSLPSHKYKLDSSPEKSPQTTTKARQRKPPKKEATNSKEPNSSLADTDDSSEDEEVIIRTPLTRSGRTRIETVQPPHGGPKNSGASPKPRRGRSPRVTPTPEKSGPKKRKPPSASSPSPPSSSPHGSSGGKQKVSRKKRHCSPAAERVLRSSLTANPASNTRSSRNQLLYFPSSNRGRKAKT